MESIDYAGAVVRIEDRALVHFLDQSVVEHHYQCLLLRHDLLDHILVLLVHLIVLILGLRAVSELLVQDIGLVGALLLNLALHQLGQLFLVVGHLLL